MALGRGAYLNFITDWDTHFNFIISSARRFVVVFKISLFFRDVLTWAWRVKMLLIDIFVFPSKMFAFPPFWKVRPLELVMTWSASLCKLTNRWASYCTTQNSSRALQNKSSTLPRWRYQVFYYLYIFMVFIK